MATIDFGLMLQPSLPNASGQELLDYNRQLIGTLSSAFTTIWAEDHLEWGEVATIECFSTLVYFAAEFPTYRVGSLVMCQAFRHPSLLAKMAANLQALSGGRFILGIGAGWKEEEYRAYGYAFPGARERVEQLEEAAIILKSMWTERPASFAGKHYQITNAYCEPQPSPSIPLLIGGGGEQRTLALVARHADWYNFNSCTVEQYARKVAILKQHCASIGRNPSEIKLTYLGTVSVSEDPAKVVRTPQKHYIAGNSDEVTRELQQFCDLGVTHFMFRFLDIETLRYFCEAVAPKFG